MKFKILLTATVLSSVLFASDLNQTKNKSLEAYKKEGVKYIKMLGGALKKELQAQMKIDSSGLSAMVFCTEQADSLTKSVNEKLPSYASVRRATLKARNSSNKADTLDEGVMDQFIREIAENKDVKTKPLLVETLSSYRIYKPLMIQPVCLKCHGDENKISSDIKKVIIDKYPQDMATGFKLGDLRGVVVSEIKK